MTVQLATAFNEGSGSTTADASGNGRTLTATGSPWTASGHTGAAAAGSASARFTRAALGFGLTDFTVMAWVYVSTTAEYQTVLQFSAENFWLEILPSTRQLGFYFAAGVSVGYSSATALPANTWTHVAVTRSGTTATMYINGVSVATATATATAVSSSTTLYVAGHTDGSFCPRLDDLRIDNTALTAAEITTLMNTPVAAGVTGTAAQTALLPTHSASGTVVPPSQTGTSAATAPAATQTASGTVGLAVPSGLAVSGVDGGLAVSFTAVPGADGYVVEWRRTDLSPPSLHTQAGAPGHLDRLDDASGTDGTYTYTYDGSGVRVYVCDSGVRYTHQEFTGRTAPGLSFGATAYDVGGDTHGTAVASAALGTTYGVAKGATVVSINLWDTAEWAGDDTTGAQMQTIADFVLADLAAHGGARGVVNLSTGLAGMQRGSTTTDTLLQAQITRLLDAGVPVCVALHNDGADVSARLTEGDARIIWGGNSNLSDARSSTSNYATQTTAFAPAENMTAASSASNSATATFGGTSGATPMIAGVAAKILQANPQISVARLKEVIASQGRNVITDVPAGPNLLLNSDAQTSSWSRHPTTSTTLTLEGLDNSHAYEVRVRTVKGAQESGASSAAAATTGVITGTSAAAAPMATQTAVGVFAPARTGTSAVTAPVVTMAASGTVGMPGSTGTSTAAAPLPVQASSGTVTPPAVTGAAVCVAPLVTMASSGAASSPPGTAAFTAPLPVQSAAGSVTLPTITGTSAAASPAATSAANGVVTMPGTVGTCTAVTPMATQAAAGTVTPPSGITGTAAATTPRPAQSAAGGFAPVTITGTAVLVAPGPVMLAVGAAPVTVTGTGSMVAPAPIMVAIQASDFTVSAGAPILGSGIQSGRGVW